MFKRLKKVALIPVIIGLLLIPYSLFLSKSNAKAEETQAKEKVYYYLHDHLGGIDAVVDEDGNVVERKDYLPYGSERAGDSESDENYGYTGKELDDETGLYYYGARYYDPAIARFTQIDPLVLGESEKGLESALTNPQRLNSYLYVRNNPLKYIDNNGQWEEPTHYGDTYNLGRLIGLPEEIAKTIARADQYTDENPATAPGDFNSINGVGTAILNYVTGVTNKYHFSDSKSAFSRIDDAINNVSVESFGNALHTVQDIGSHGKFDSDKLAPIKHLSEGNAPDKPALNIDEYNKTRETTIYELYRFNNALSGEPDDAKARGDTRALMDQIGNMCVDYSQINTWQFTPMSPAPISSPSGITPYDVEKYLGGGKK